MERGTTLKTNQENTLKTAPSTTLKTDADEIKTPIGKLTIRKEFMYAYEWPSERDMIEPVYKESNQVVRFAWSGVLMAAGLYSLFAGLVYNRLRHRFLKYWVEDFTVAITLAAAGLVLTFMAVGIVHLFIECLVLFWDKVSPRRAILFGGATSLIPVSVLSFFYFTIRFGQLAGAIALFVGLWFGAYGAVFSAGRFGKWVYTDRKRPRSEMIQFQLREMFALTTLVVFFVLIDQATTGFSVLKIFGVSTVAFASLFFFDRWLLRIQGEF